MFRVIRDSIEVYREVDNTVASDVYSPPRIPNHTQRFSSRPTAIDTRSARGPAPTTVDYLHAGPSILHPVGAVHESGRLLVHLHPRHGTASLFRIDWVSEKSSSALPQGTLEQLGTLCFRRHYTQPLRAAELTFIPSKVTSVSPRVRRFSTGSSGDVSNDGLRWEEQQLTGAPFVGVDFVGARTVALMTNTGRVSTFDISAAVLLAGDECGDAGSAVKPLGHVHALDGPVGPFCGVPSREWVVACTSVGGHCAVVNARDCSVLHTTKLIGAGITSDAVLLSCTASEVIVGAMRGHGNTLALLRLRDNSHTTKEATANSAPFETILDSMTITDEETYESFGSKTTVELPDLQLGNQETWALAQVKSESTLRQLAPHPAGNGVVAAVAAEAVVVFSRLSKTLNVLGVATNDLAAPFTRCLWSEATLDSSRWSLVVERVGGPAAVFEVSLDPTMTFLEEPIEFIGELETESLQTTRFSSQELRKQGVPVLRLRSVHHPLCSTEAAPKLAAEAAGGSAADPTATGHEFSVVSAPEPEDATVFMKVFDINKKPTIATVLSSGAVVVSEMGGADADVQIVPPDMKTETESSMITSVLLLPARSGSTALADLICVVGDEKGRVLVWCGGRCIAMHNVHSDAVTTLFAVPANKQRVDGSFCSLAFDGSFALHREGSFDILAIMHAPCKFVTGAFWDEQREWLTLVSASGANVWHLITGKLERCSSDFGLIEVYTAGRRNYLFDDPPSEATNFLRISRFKMVHHSTFAVTIFLDKVLDGLVNIKKMQGAATPPPDPLSPPVTSPTMLSPETGLRRADDSGSPISFASLAGQEFLFNIPETLLVAVGFLLCRDDTPEVARVCDMLRLPVVQQPHVVVGTNQARFGDSNERTAHHLIVSIATLRALGQGVSDIEKACNAAILSYSRGIIGDLPAKGLCSASISECVHAMDLQCAPIQFAGRVVLNATIRCTSPNEVDRVFDQLDELLEADKVESTAMGTADREYDPDARASGSTHSARSVILTAKTIVVIQSTKKSDGSGIPSPSSNDSFRRDQSFSLVGRSRATAVAMELEEAALAAAEKRQEEPFLSALAEGWPILKGSMNDAPGLFMSLFTNFCFYKLATTNDSYRSSYGARAVTQIAGHDIHAFCVFCNKLTAADNGIDHDAVATRIACLNTFMRLIQVYPTIALPEFDTILNFVWRAIDPHSPRRSDRERCFPAVASLFRMAVHCMPMVSFNQTQQRLLVGHNDGHVIVFDVKTTSKLTSFKACNGAPVAALEYSSVGHDIAVLSAKLDMVYVYRLSTSGLWGMLNVSSTFKFHTGHKIPTCAALEREITAFPGHYLPVNQVVKTCKLTWVSPNCVEVSSPWHNRLQIMIQ